ncbi:MAG: Kelch repeat-containing protein, partial [Planctomycetota bacterium]
MWDPTTSTWSSLGTGSANGVSGWVNALAALDGKLYVGGGYTNTGVPFNTAGGLPANNIAAWDPATSTWSSLGTGSANGVNYSVNALAALDGKLYVGGLFSTAGGATANNVAAWDPATSAWSSLGTGSANGVNSIVSALAALDGKLYVGGGAIWTAGGVTVNNIAAWDPATSTWSSLGTGSANGVDGGLWGVYALTVLDGTLYVGGNFRTAGGLPANNIATWDPATSRWSRLGTLIKNGVGGEFHSVFALAALDGTLYVGGEFSSAGGAFIPYLSEWGNPDVGVASTLLMATQPSSSAAGGVAFSTQPSVR